MVAFLFFFVAAVTVGVNSLQQCPPSRASIEQSLGEARIPGLVAIVVNSSDILYDQAFGFQAPPIINPNEPMNSENSIFVLASISKTFIAIAAMQFVESRQLDLDRDINHYLSPLPKIFHPRHSNIIITMRNVLSHMASIGPNLDEELKELYLPGDDFTRTNLVDVVYNYLKKEGNWLPEVPGTVAFYSNVGSTLAALVIERIANISFEQYVYEKILKRLGINRIDAGYRLSDFEDRKRDLVGHYIFNASYLPLYETMVPQLNAYQVANGSDWLYIPFFGLSDYPAGLLRMSARTLSIFLQSFLNNGKPLVAQTTSIDEMLRVYGRQSQQFVGDVEYGLIWTWFQSGKRRLIGHRGSLPGFTNSMMANEQRTMGVIMLSNGDITRGDAQAMEVYKASISIMTELFDCFDRSGCFRMQRLSSILSIILLLALFSNYLFY